MQFSVFRFLDLIKCEETTDPIVLESPSQPFFYEIYIFFFLFKELDMQQRFIIILLKSLIVHLL